MAKKRDETALVPLGFDYSPLSADVAKQVKSTAEKIREKVKRAIEDIIEVGNGLITVKDALPHGQFGPWLRAEFGWSERIAQNFMSVAERFGPKTEIIADLSIQPTAAYLLAAPSPLTRPGRLLSSGPRSGSRSQRLSQRRSLLKRGRRAEGRQSLFPPINWPFASDASWSREQWDADDLSGLARQFREFADALEKLRRSGRKRG